MNKLIKTLFFILIFNIALLSCRKAQEKSTPPNILWVYLEDTAPLMGCYGTEIISTPNIDQLAKSGTLFTSAIMPAPVCSASRSSNITGIMSTTLGAHNHHSSRTEESAIYLPDSVKTLPELFKEAGYFTFNNGKDDYNFIYDREDLYSQDYSFHPLYGKSGVRLAIDSLKEKQPFFGQIQLNGGKEIFSSSFKEQVKTPVDRSLIVLPPYLPNHPTIIEEYANHLDAIQITDEIVGTIIEKLKQSGVLENTIVFFFSDHGMRLTKNKQFLYEGGIHVPLIIADFRASNTVKAGAINSELISGIDFAPISLGLAGLTIPSQMEGIDVLDEKNPPRDYIISTRDRCDFTIDRIRSVRTKEYKYIRNFMPERAYTQLTYMDVDEIAFVKVMKQLFEENKLNATQQLFMQDHKPVQELYDLKNDPFELKNLANDSAYASVLATHANILDDWIINTNDQGQYLENEEGLKLMLGIWGKHAINPEYELLREKYPDLAGSLWDFKNSGWQRVEHQSNLESTN